MPINAITYPNPGQGRTTAALDTSRQLIYCPRNGMAGIVSRAFCPGGSAPVSTHVDENSIHVVIPDYGELSASVDDAAPGRAISRLDENRKRVLPRVLFYLPLEDVLSGATGTTGLLARTLVALIDTGTPDRNLDRAHSWLERFLEVQGRSRKPGTLLATLQARKEKLTRELQEVERARNAVVALAADLHARREDLYRVRARRKTLRLGLQAAVATRARQLRRRIKDLTRRLDEFEGKPYLESHKAAAVKRKKTQADTARLQWERTRGELEKTRHALSRLSESARHPQGTSENAIQVPADLEREVRILATAMGKIQAGLAHANKEADAIGEHIRDEEDRLSAMPDFTRIAPDPADWLNQLASSLNASIAARHQEEEELRELRRQIEVQSGAITGEEALFSEIDDLDAVLNDYKKKKSDLEREMDETRKRALQHKAGVDNTRSNIPGIITLGFGSALCLLFILGLYVSVDKPPLLYAAAILFLAVIYFLAWFLNARSDIVRLTQHYNKAQTEMERIVREHEENEGQINRILARAGCVTTRELEARYDNYLKDYVHLDDMREQARLMEESLLESNERVPLLFERIRETLETLDEHPKSPNDVEQCVANAIRKSGEYRATVRTLANLRNQLQGFAGRRRFLEGELAEAREALAPLEKEVRNRIRRGGFREDVRFTEMNDLLDAYQQFITTANEINENREQLSARLEELEQQARGEESLCARHTEELAVMLRQYGFEGADAVEPAARNAALISDLTRERQEAMGELEGLPQGPHNGIDYDAETCPEDEGEITPAAIQEAQRDLAACEEDYDRAWADYRVLRDDYRSRLAGWRGRHEIEEDLAALDAAERECRRRLAAGARARALIDDLAPQWRAHHGNAIAKQAETMLGELGFPVNITLDLTREIGDNRVTIQHEQDVALDPGILHLSLRLAALETLARSDMPEPLLVDGTLQNTPLPREPGALFALLDRMASRRQVLLFSDNAFLTLAALESGWPALAI